MDKAKKPKALPTRPYRGLRKAAAAALALLAVNLLLNIGYILPIQAVRDFERREGIPEKTAVILRRRIPEISRSFMLYLTGGEKATALGAVRLSAYGWVQHNGSSLDCTAGAPFYIGEQTHHWRSDSQAAEGIWYFGRVDDGDIARIEVRVLYAGYDEAAKKPVFPEAYRLESRREDWLEKDGRSYFLMEQKPLEWPYDSGIYAVAAAYGRNGELLHEIDINERFSSIHGLGDSSPLLSDRGSAATAAS